MLSTVLGFRIIVSLGEMATGRGCRGVSGGQLMFDFPIQVCSLHRCVPLGRTSEKCNSHQMVCQYMVKRISTCVSDNQNRLVCVLHHCLLAPVKWKGKLTMVLLTY